MTEHPAGWYPDPYDRARERYWNGSEWTDDYRPAPSAEPGPPGSWAPPGSAPSTGAAGGRPDIPNHLVWAILSTLLCCLPLGIVSIVKSSQVNTLVATGHYDEAWKASEEAKKWAIISAATAVGLGVLYILLAVVLAAGSSV